jgi:predicted Zn-dependent protease DUF2268
MIKTNWIPTNQYYHRILAAPDAAAREQLYLELLIEPWRPMMQMMRGAPGAGGDDPLAGARAWAWLLPDQVDTIGDILEQMEAADAWRVGGEALAVAAARFAAFGDRIPFDQITDWLVLADPARSNPLERGYTGATDWLSPRFIGQFWEPNEDNLPRLPGLVAHEMHHLIRLRAFPWDLQRTSVADYIVLEGTAESFAASLFGEQAVGYFITEFEPAEFETARRLIGAGLRATGFDVIRSYIFGDALAQRSGYTPLGGMPTYGGYTIGYHVVQAFLKRSGRSIEEATFLPADEIVAGSGFFD